MWADKCIKRSFSLLCPDCYLAARNIRRVVSGFITFPFEIVCRPYLGREGERGGGDGKLEASGLINRLGLCFRQLLCIKPGS